MKKIIDFIKAKQKLLLIVIGIYIILRIFSIGILFFAFTIEADETYKDKEYWEITNSIVCYYAKWLNIYHVVYTYSPNWFMWKNVCPFFDKE